MFCQGRIHTLSAVPPWFTNDLVPLAGYQHIPGKWRLPTTSQNTRYDTYLWLRPQRSIWQCVSCPILSISDSLSRHHCRYLRVNGLKKYYIFISFCIKMILILAYIQSRVNTARIKGRVKFLWTFLLTSPTLFFPASSIILLIRRRVTLLLLKTGDVFSIIPNLIFYSGSQSIIRITKTTMEIIRKSFHPVHIFRYERIIVIKTVHPYLIINVHFYIDPKTWLVARTERIVLSLIWWVNSKC